MARKSLAVLCRRTMRPLVTETDFTFLPIRSRAKEARTVSTSGSSGIASPPGVLGGTGLGALLRAALAGSHGPVGDAHDRGVRRVVARARRGDLVVRGAQAVGLTPLAKARLRIRVARTRRGVGDGLGQHLVDEGLGRVVAVLQIDRGDQRLEGVSQQRRALQSVLF